MKFFIGKPLKTQLIFYSGMEVEIIKLPKQLMNSIRELVRKNKLYQDEQEFVMDAIITQIRKYKGA